MAAIAGAWAAGRRGSQKWGVRSWWGCTSLSLSCRYSSKPTSAVGKLSFVPFRPRAGSSCVPAVGRRGEGWGWEGHDRENSSRAGCATRALAWALGHQATCLAWLCPCPCPVLPKTVRKRATGTEEHQELAPSMRQNSFSLWLSGWDPSSALGLPGVLFKAQFINLSHIFLFVFVRFTICISSVLSLWDVQTPAE